MPLMPINNLVPRGCCDGECNGNCDGDPALQLASVKKMISSYFNALSGLLSVLNHDDDGGWFICREAGLTVKNAQAVVGNHFSENICTSVKTCAEKGKKFTWREFELPDLPDSNGYKLITGEASKALYTAEQMQLYAIAYAEQVAASIAEAGGTDPQQEEVMHSVVQARESAPVASEADSKAAAPKQTELAENFDFIAHLSRQRLWSEKTFGPGSRSAGVVDHILKELCEIEEDPSDLMEWIDVVILALDGAWRANYSPKEIIQALCEKQAKNERRDWPDWRTADPNKAIEHDRSGEPASEDGLLSPIGREAAGRAELAYQKPGPKSLSARAIVAGMIARHKYMEAHPYECEKPSTHLDDLELLAAHLQHADSQQMTTQGDRTCICDGGIYAPNQLHPFIVNKACPRHGESPADGAGSEAVAEICNKYGDPEKFAERWLRELIDIQKLPIGTKLDGGVVATMIGLSGTLVQLRRPSDGVEMTQVLKSGLSKMERGVMRDELMRLAEQVSRLSVGDWHEDIVARDAIESGLRQLAERSIAMEQAMTKPPDWAIAKAFHEQYALIPDWDFRGITPLDLSFCSAVRDRAEQLVAEAGGSAPPQEAESKTAAQSQGAERNDEDCETCGGFGTIDELLGGIARSNPEAKCPSCDGRGCHPTVAVEPLDEAIRKGTIAWADVPDSFVEDLRGAEAAVACTCPSGDGSLRWPCPQHPPTHQRCPLCTGSILTDKHCAGAECPLRPKT